MPPEPEPPLRSRGARVPQAPPEPALPELVPRPQALAPPELVPRAAAPLPVPSLPSLRFRPPLAGCCGSFLALGLVDRCHRDVHRLALEQRGPLNHAVVLDLLGEAGQQVSADLRVGQLASPELDGDLDPVAFLEELDRPPDLRVEVALADLRLEADFLEGDRTLLALGFLFAFGELVLVLPEIEEPDDRRSGHGRDLDEVVAAFLRESERLEGRHDPSLCSIFVDDPDLGDSDHLVDAQVSADGWFLDADSAIRPTTWHAGGLGQSMAEDSTGVRRRATRGPQAGVREGASPPMSRNESERYRARHSRPTYRSRGRCRERLQGGQRGNSRSWQMR